MARTEATAVQTWRSLVRAKAEISRVLHKGLRESGLSGAQLGILRVLSQCGDGGVKLNEISQRLYFTPANLTGLLDRLEEAGWLRRTAHAEDRRITLAILTSEGKDLFEQIYPAHTARIKHVMSGLTCQEQRSLTELLTRLSERATQATD